MPFEEMAPDCWPRFVKLVNSTAPTCPLPAARPSAARETRQTGAQALGFGQAFVQAAGGQVHPAIGAATGLAGANSAGDVANVAVDTGTGAAAGRFLRGVEGAGLYGLVLGGVVNLLRGGYQSLVRSDAVRDYLVQFLGYKTTLARTAIATVDRGLPYATMPRPLIPEDMNLRVCLPREREAYRRGAMRVERVIREMDRIRPVHGDHYSAQAFIHLFLVGAGVVTTRAARRDARTRDAIQRYVDTRLLGRSLERERLRLLRYANTGR